MMFARNAIKKDLLFFAPPALIIFTAGLIFSARDGWEGLPTTLRKLIEQPERLFSLPAQNIAGLALILSGFTIILVAHFTLGRAYSSTLVIRKDHQLVTHGIYRFARHPIYLGAIMICMGVPVHASSLRGLLTMLALIPVLLIRIRIEERLLSEAFGDAHQIYMDSTRKLIPFIF